MTELFGENLHDKIREYNPYLFNDNRTVVPYRFVEWDIDLSEEKLTYDKHEKRLRFRKSVRAPTPQEVISLLIAYEDNGLPAELKNVAESMMGKSELLCCAARMMRGQLLIYEYVENIFNLPGLDCMAQQSGVFKKEYYWDIEPARTFDMGVIKMGSAVPISVISKYNPDLVEYFYTRPFEHLPEKIQKNASMSFYPSETINMITRRIDNSPYDIVHGLNKSHSRGVREK